MENLFKMENLKEVTLDYKNMPFDNLELEIIDSFYIYEYIIKQVLPVIIKKYKKDIELRFQYVDAPDENREFPSFDVHWLNSVSIDTEFLDFFLRNSEDALCNIFGSSYAKNKNIKVNKKTFDLLIKLFKNFINSYKLGSNYNIDSNCICFNIDAPLYQLIDAFYSEWQRIDYETKEIIEDYQEEYGIDRKVLLPGESDINILKRK